MVSGIYEILNTVNGKRYIGQSVDIKSRWVRHRGQLRRGVSCHKYLQAAWNKYGEVVFTFSILGECAPQYLTFFEQAWMDARKPEYNLAPAAGSVLGYKHTPKTRKQMSASHMGNNNWLGKKHTPEAHERMVTAKINNLYWLGKTHTPEARKRMSAAQIGNKKMLGKKRTLETRKLISDAKIGKKHTPETKAKLSAQRIGKPWSPARRAAQLRRE